MLAPIIYLAHPMSGAGLPSAWMDAGANAARVERLACGVAAVVRGARCRYAVPGMDGMHRRRLILGDGPVPSFGPLGDPLMAVRLLAVDRVWVVGLADYSVEQDKATAEQAGLPVVEIPVEQQAEFEGAARAVEMRRGEVVAAEAVAAALTGRNGDEPTIRLTPRRVLVAFFLADGRTLGGGGVDYERAAGARGIGGAVAFRQAAEDAAFRLVIARRIVRAAGISVEALAALRERAVRDRSYRQVALALGWGDTEQAEERARSMCRRGMAAVGRAVRLAEAAG